MEKKDIFDRIMELPVFNIFEESYKAHKEMLLYLFFGGLTTLISILIFGGLNIGLAINALVANIISWIISVAFAFVTNRIWVFTAAKGKSNRLIVQMINFYMGRILTLLVEEILLFVFITKCGINSMIVKIIAQIVVIVLNYIISKKWVYKN